MIYDTDTARTETKENAKPQIAAQPIHPTYTAFGGIHGRCYSAFSASSIGGAETNGGS